MLVDTDVLIWYLRGHEGAARFLEGLPDLALSVVTYMELVQGCRNRKELERLTKDLGRRKARILPVSEGISNRAAALVKRMPWVTTCCSPMPSSPPPPSRRVLPWHRPT